jgi:hypothetical protein
MAKYKRRERLKKPAEAALKPASMPGEDSMAAQTAETGKETVTGMQQLYGNRVLQRLADDSIPVDLNAEVATRINTSRGRGNPLDKEMAQAMNSAFAHDFSDVRVHDDSEANSLAHEVHARAFTVGNDVYLKDGSLDLHTDQGVDILSHELTHVVRQRRHACQPAGTGTGSRRSLRRFTS